MSAVTFMKATLNNEVHDEILHPLVQLPCKEYSRTEAVVTRQKLQWRYRTHARKVVTPCCFIILFPNAKLSGQEIALQAVLRRGNILFMLPSISRFPHPDAVVPAVISGSDIQPRPSAPLLSLSPIRESKFSSQKQALD